MPTRLSCACVLVPAAGHDVAGLTDRLIADLVPQIGPRPHNPVIAPVTVLPRHPNDQLLNLSLDLRPAGAECAPNPFVLRASRFAIACPRNRSQQHPARLRRERTTHRLFYSSNFLPKRLPQIFGPRAIYQRPATRTPNFCGSGFVLERKCDACAKCRDLSVLHLHVHFGDFGHA
jgi:hypothetical protein